MKTLLKFQFYMTNRKFLLPLALFLSALSAIMAIIPYLLIWLIVREFLFNAANYSVESINLFSWGAAGIAIMSVILYFIALSFSHLVAFRVETNIRRYTMQKIIKMPLGFFNKNTTGRIRNIIDENASITHGFIAHQVPDLAGTILMPLIITVLIFVFDWRLGIAVLTPIIFSMFIMNFMMGKKGKYFMKTYMTSLEEMNTEAVEYVRGIPVVKVFQQTVYSFKNFYNSIVQYRKMVVEYTRLWEKPMSLYLVLINGFVFFLVPVSILLITNTGNSAKILLDLFLYVLITPIFSQSIMRSMYLNQAFGQAREAISRIEKLTDEKDLLEVYDPQKIKNYDIIFDHVSFTYPTTNKRVVNDISFSISKGQIVALVGPSGSGKTTIARLLPRFWDVTSGKISIGGVSIKNISTNDLMQNISFVFQNTRLFKMSLLDNICYGSPKASLNEVNRALDLAQCQEIIHKLPQGLDTVIGTKGTYLSGGEQQRIILARAILKNAPMIVLDEATAFADPENEYLLQKALKQLTLGKTVLMIAHRLTSVMNADKILVINEGRIVEEGIHEELLKNENLYSKMWDEYRQSVQWTLKKEENNA